MMIYSTEDIEILEPYFYDKIFGYFIAMAKSVMITE